MSDGSVIGETRSASERLSDYTREVGDDGGEIGRRQGMVVQFGRSEQEWAQLVEVGRRFLVERAVMRRTTSYTEFNAALVNRANTAGFNFDLDADRAAIGELLGRISKDTYVETGGLLISALVQYLDTNDAGPGFYALARSKGLPVPTNPEDRQLFWASHVAKVHEHYARHPTST